jgi:hypothetical protein
LNSIKRPIIKPIDLLNPVRVALFEPDSKIKSPFDHPRY